MCINHLIQDCINESQNITEKLSKCSIKSKTISIKKNDINEELNKKIKKLSANIYMLSVFGKNHNEIISKFRDNKKENAHYPRENTITQGSMCLYVGSSKSVITRLRQHFSSSSTQAKSGIKQTYALYLDDWYWHDCNIQLTLISCSIQNKDIDWGIIQFIENKLWDNMKPLFGKKGNSPKID